MRNFGDNQFNTDLFNVDLDSANYYVQIGSNLILALVADLFED